MHEPPLTDSEIASLRLLADVTPALLDLAGALIELDQSAVNVRPLGGIAVVDSDGAILYPIACARRLADLAAGKKQPRCAWLPLEDGSGFRCRECRRVEVGGERAALIARLSGA